MSFKNDSFFAPPFKTIVLDYNGETFHYLNGLAEEHSAFSKLISEPKTQQLGWEKAAYHLSCDDKGNLRFKGVVGMKEFHENVDRNLAREAGMAIMGISKKSKSDFDMKVDEEEKNSKTAKEDSTG